MRIEGRQADRLIEWVVTVISQARTVFDLRLVLIPDAAIELRGCCRGMRWSGVGVGNALLSLLRREVMVEHSTHPWVPWG